MRDSRSMYIINIENYKVYKLFKKSTFGGDG
jgi:hypothetical protein